MQVHLLFQDFRIFFPSLPIPVTTRLLSFAFEHTDVEVIEFQKHGLPHSHILLTLSSRDKLTTVEEIDDIISAEISDKDTNPLLYEIVLRTMIHGPCGPINPNSPCMVNGRCSKHYPKRFYLETTIGENGYVIYRRRNNGRVVILTTLK